MARSKAKRKKKYKGSDNLHRSAPKHSAKDLVKAMSIAGLVIAAFASLFVVKIDSKPVLVHLTDMFSSEVPAKDVKSKTTQMDRYTEEESEGLDKLIKEKSK